MIDRLAHCTDSERLSPYADGTEYPDHQSASHSERTYSDYVALPTRQFKKGRVGKAHLRGLKSISGYGTCTQRAGLLPLIKDKKGKMRFLFSKIIETVSSVRPLCIMTLKSFVALKVQLLGQTFLKTHFV